MSSNVTTTTAATGLANLATFRAGLAQTRASITATAGLTPLLRLLKDGQWVMGREDNAIANGTEAVINPASFQTGYSCWTNRAPTAGKNELMGEEMYGIGQQKPPISSLPVHNDPRTQERCEWREQMALEMKLVSGAYAGTQTLYKTASVGGVRAMTRLLDAIMARLDAGEATYICPVVAMSSDSYQHASFGRTYVPVLEIVGWADIFGNEEDDVGAADSQPKAAPEPAPAPVDTAPAGRRRRV